MKLLEAIKAATSEDLAEIEKELVSLREARKLVDVRINGKPKRAAPTTRKQSSGSLAERIYDVITDNGPGTSAAIAAKLPGVSAQSVGVCCAKANWFEKTALGDQWTIAKSRGDASS